MTGWRNLKVGRRPCIQCDDKQTQSQGKFALVMIELRGSFTRFRCAISCRLCVFSCSTALSTSLISGPLARHQLSAGLASSEPYDASCSPVLTCASWRRCSPCQLSATRAAAPTCPRLPCVALPLCDDHLAGSGPREEGVGGAAWLRGEAKQGGGGGLAGAGPGRAAWLRSGNPGGPTRGRARGGGGGGRAEEGGRCAGGAGRGGRSGGPP